MRQFRDTSGVEWQVFFTERRAASERRDQYLPEAYRGGWLVFECAVEKRRLAPVPADWAELSDQALEALCATAARQPSRPSSAKQPPSPQPADMPAPQPPPAREPAPPARLLQPSLEAATTRLAQTLEDVCDTPRVEQLDTGELIRVEETLAIAADAAKEAVSIRKKMREEQQGSRDDEG